MGKNETTVTNVKDETRPGFLARATATALHLVPVRAFLRYSERRGPMLADSVTYRALFSVFAAALLGFSLAGLWLQGNPVAWQALLDAVSTAIPGLLAPEGPIDPDAISFSVGLSLASILSLAGLVGAAIGAIGSLRTAIRQICERITDDVAWWLVLVRNALLALGAGVAFLASAAVTVLGATGLDVLADGVGPGWGQALLEWGSGVLGVLVTFVLDAAFIAILFTVLSGVTAHPRALWTGAIVGGAALTVLQQLSGLFVRGATGNPLLAPFASLIALLLWINLSVQVILIVSSLIMTLVEERNDRVRARFGAVTFAQRRVRRAEDAVRLAREELDAARTAEAAERSGV